MTVALPTRIAAARGTVPRVVVIGAGLGGLSAALRLLAAGMDVTVVEREPTPGGRAGQIREAGFTFDTGPSLITMPEVIDDLFRVAGTTTGAQLRMHALDPFYRIAWEGENRSFLFGGDRDEMIRQITQFSAEDAAQYDSFLESSRHIHEQAILGAGRRPFLRLQDFMGLVPAMARLGALRSVDGFVGRFFRDPHIRQAFGFHPLYIGGDPFRVPAVYAALAYLQIAGGVWYAEGGVYALVQRMAALLESGGTLRLGCRVRSIVDDGSRVRGVLTEDGETLPADIVISNADVVATQRDLLDRRPLRTPSLTMSCYLLYIGCNRKFPQLHHHTLLVGQDYQGFIRAVTRSGELPNSVSLYVHTPSRTEPSMAPPGGESIAVLLPVPNLRSQVYWTHEEPEVRERVLHALESPKGLGLSGLRDSIVLERSWTPLDFQNRLGAVDGNAFGPEPLLRQSAYFRQPNRDRSLRGMYYVGAGTHPGAGIPGVLLTAEVTSNLITADVMEAVR